MSLDINSLEKSLDTFISEYQNKVSNQNACNVIKDFHQDWVQVIPSYANASKEENLDIEYGKALLPYNGDFRKKRCFVTSSLLKVSMYFDKTLTSFSWILSNW